MQIFPYFDVYFLNFHSQFASFAYKNEQNTGLFPN